MNPVADRLLRLTPHRQASELRKLVGRGELNLDEAKMLALSQLSWPDHALNALTDDSVFRAIRDCRSWRASDAGSEGATIANHPSTNKSVDPKAAKELGPAPQTEWMSKLARTSGQRDEVIDASPVDLDFTDPKPVLVGPKGVRKLARKVVRWFRLRLSGLSQDEIKAMDSYSNFDYRRINPHMRGIDRKSGDSGQQIETTISTLLKAFAKIPDYHGISYRGAMMSEKTVTRYVPGAVLSDEAFWSSDAQLGKAYGFQRRNIEDQDVSVFFVIEGRSGKDISFVSKNPLEHEVLFAPKTKFRIVRRKDLGDAVRLHIREL